MFLSLQDVLLPYMKLDIWPEDTLFLVAEEDLRFYAECDWFFLAVRRKEKELKELIYENKRWDLLYAYWEGVDSCADLGEFVDGLIDQCKALDAKPPDDQTVEDIDDRFYEELMGYNFTKVGGPDHGKDEDEESHELRDIVAICNYAKKKGRGEMVILSWAHCTEHWVSITTPQAPLPQAPLPAPAPEHWVSITEPASGVFYITIWMEGGA